MREMLHIPAAAAWSPPQKLVALFGALAFLVDGMGTQAMGLALPAIIKAWSVPRAALATATAVGLVGFALGAALGGLCGDRLGRHRTLIASLLLLGIATAACGLARTTADLGVVRIFVGLGLGASLPNAATLIAESTPLRHRSVALSVGLAFLPLGGFMEALGAAYLLPAFGWRGLFVATGTLAVSMTCALGWYRPPTRSVGPATRLPVGRSLLRLLAPQSLRDTLGICSAFFLTVMIYYSVFSWLPAGIAAEGRASGVASAAMSAFSVGGLLGGLLAGMSIQRWGSRVTLLVLCGGSAVVGFCLAGFAHAAATDGTALVLAVGLLGAGVIGMQTALFALGAFVYTAELRSSGIGFAVAWGRAGAIASSYTGVMTLDRGGLAGFFLFIGLAAIAAAGTSSLIFHGIPARSALEN